MKFLVGKIEHKLFVLKQIEAAVEGIDTAECKDSILVLLLDKATNEFYKHIAL